MFRTGELDPLVTEDIGGMGRRGEAVRPSGNAVDHGTRVLAPNDGINTTEDSWEEDVISACRDHVGHTAHTSKRLMLTAKVHRARATYSQQSFCDASTPSVASSRLNSDQS